MIFESYIPDNYLKDHVECLMYFKDFMPDHSIERVIPTGHSFVIFELDGFTRNTFDNETLKPNKEFTKVWISGMHKNYISISAHQKSEMFVIQFKSEGAYPFLHVPAHELSDKVFQAEELFGDEILALRSSIVSAEGPQEKFATAEAWLEQRFDGEKKAPQEIHDIIATLRQRSNGDSLGSLLDGYPHSQKHLIDQFKRYVGLTPKYYHRLLRFNEILAKIQQKQPLSWSQITYDYGFSDQPHFIKDFKHFSGFNPSEFIKEDFDETNFFPLDRQG